MKITTNNTTLFPPGKYNRRQKIEGLEYFLRDRFTQYLSADGQIERIEEKIEKISGALAKLVTVLAEKDVLKKEDVEEIVGCRIRSIEGGSNHE